MASKLVEYDTHVSAHARERTLNLKKLVLQTSTNLHGRSRPFFHLRVHLGKTTLVISYPGHFWEV